ncbi:MAG: DsbE family thiol:disulfide interchange protein [Phenylobacterium sp.]|uniref:DsbE family thiol:disulfide interchange protein n=1 Tax=Phenylobacterium sp. TaxID=1871053 RepID=UPI00271A0CAA|nr:DsbE family thiol:disulfide interchange protein [Phenylobacterium sp.]MDO8411955.1 DsbE family thiol:disulfide interchange protein [Phenylobacterium sp.]|tara:strand:+ start:3451 stop:4005 length:555 start_codon:yes stop_codon:yes gene_type:complete
MNTGRFRWGALIPAALFLVVAGFFLIAIFRGDPSRVPSPLIGRAVPVFSLPAIEGIDRLGFETADFAHGTPVIVNVWASWCVPCRDEHAVLSELKKLTDAPIYGLNYKDSAESAKRFLTELGNPFARIGADVKGRVALDWGVYGVPETYIIDGKGHIAYKHVGPLTAQIVDDEILPALRAASAR